MSGLVVVVFVLVACAGIWAVAALNSARRSRSLIGTPTGLDLAERGLKRSVISFGFAVAALGVALVERLLR